MSASLVQRYDPFGPEVMANPLPFYEALRDEAPVHYLPEYDTFILTRFQDVWDVLGNVDNVFLSTEGSLPLPSQLRVHNNGAVPDPPTDPIGNANSFGSPIYEQFRQAQGRPLRPGAVARLEQMLREAARERLDALIPQGEFDIVQDYGGHVSATAVCYLLGLDRDQAAEVLRIVNMSTQTHANDAGEPGLDLAVLLERALAHMRPYVERQRAQIDAGEKADGGVVQGLMDMEFQGRMLSDPEVTRNMICIFVGGTETVPKVTGHGIWELLKNPEQLAAVKENLAENVKIAREEFFRYCAPAQWFARTVREETEVNGVKMKPGQRVLSVIASAQRDPREYENPEVFQWDRKIERSVAFGRGQHFCVGYHLARLEVAILTEEFLSRVDSFDVDEDAAIRHPSSFQWGYNSLTVRVKD